MSKTITLRDAIRLAKKAAAADPNKVANCTYVHPETDLPECIVGNILIRDLGISTEFLRCQSSRFQTLASRLPGVTVTEDAERFLDNVQSIQDNRAAAVRNKSGDYVLDSSPSRRWQDAVNLALDVEGSKAARV
jgi:hypothetical protein